VLAEQTLRDGRVEEALAELQAEVRKAPDNAEYRVFLFQLLCVIGDWERARAQLKVLGELSAGSLPLVHLYAAAISCELLRAEVFAGSKTPLVLGEPLPWLARLFQALSVAAQGRGAEAAGLRAEALEQASAVTGIVDDDIYMVSLSATPSLTEAGGTIVYMALSGTNGGVYRSLEPEEEKELPFYERIYRFTEVLLPHAAGTEFVERLPRRLWPLYDKISQLNIPILVHDTASDRDGHPNPALVGIEQLFLETDNNALAFLLAFPFRYMVDIGSLILRGALKEFLNLRICFVEGSAAFVPWLMERLDMDIKARDRLGKLPSEFFNQIWVSAFAAETSLRYACDFWRDHNLTVGSDYPHGDPSATWSVGTVKMVRELPGMSDADKEKILGANAMRLFGL
jgi:predicted TIM-barrel fold metal-dependent hydrolase